MADELVVLHHLFVWRDGLEGEQLAQEVDHLLLLRVDQIQNPVLVLRDHGCAPPEDLTTRPPIITKRTSSSIASIFEWVSLHGDQIGEHSGFDGAAVVDTQEIRSVEGCRANGFDGRHAQCDQFGKLLGVVTMGIGAGVRSECDADASSNGGAHAPVDVCLNLVDLALNDRRVVAGHPPGVDRRHKVGTAFLHQRDGLVVEHGSMFNRSNPRIGRRNDALGAMRVCGHLDVVPRSFFDQRIEFWLRVLQRAGLMFERHDPCRGTGLDDARPVFDLVANRLEDLVDAVSNAILGPALHNSGDESSRVAVASGDANHVSGWDDPRPLDPAVGNGARQRHVGEIPGAEIANGGEARHQCASGVARAAQREIGEALLDCLVDPVVRQVVGQMGVGVHQAG